MSNFIRYGSLVAALLVFLPVDVRAQQKAGFTQTDIEDPSGRALDRFFSSLLKTSRREKGAITRIAHYGDSMIVGDIITRYVRELYQERYGDAGPGFVLAGRPWSWYRHAGITLGATKGWRTYRSISGGPPDHWYGFGGVTFITRAPRESVWITTGKTERRSLKASFVEVQYATGPLGGDLEVLVDNEQVVTINTKSDSPASAFHRIRVPDGGHRVELRTVGGGQVRLFGVVLEREGPGVVYDSLGVNNACMSSLGRMDADHLSDQFQHRRPDLIVLTYGANESNRPGLVARYRKVVLPAVRQLRRASHGASCLIVAPLDRGMRAEGGGIEPNKLIPTIVERQREVARETGCAFFNTYEGMGGHGSMRRWTAARLAGGDLCHPTKAGGAIIAQHIFDALEREFTRFRAGR